MPLSPDPTLSSGFGIMTNPAARRFACDHCHAQKLRCTKPDGGGDVCTRCQRLARACIWSSPLRSGRPAKNKHHSADTTIGVSAPNVAAASLPEPPSGITPSETTTSKSTGPPAPEEGTPSLNAPDYGLYDVFNFFSPRSFESNAPSLWGMGGDQRQCVADPPPPPPAPMASSLPCPAANTTPLDVAQALSELNVSLLRLNESLHAEPWGSMFDSPAAVVAKLTSCNNQTDTITGGYPLADIFEKTQAFIDLAKRAGGCDPPLGPPSHASASSLASSLGGFQSSSSDDDSMYGMDTSRGSSRSSNALFTEPNQPSQRHQTATGSRTARERRSTNTSDLPNALMLASCYCRILDIYLTVFTHILHFDKALAFAVASGGPDYRAMIHPAFPPLQWGGFQPTHYGPLHMLMVVQISSFLLAETERTLGVNSWELSVTQPRGHSQDRSSRSRPPKRRRGNESGEYLGHGFSGHGTPTRPTQGVALRWELIEMVAREEGPEGANGGRSGKIATLRRLIKRVKKQLEKGSITG